MASRFPMLLCAAALSGAAAAAGAPAQSAYVAASGSDYVVTAGRVSIDTTTGNTILDLDGGVTIRIKSSRILKMVAATVAVDSTTKAATAEGPVKISIDGGEITADRLVMKSHQDADAEYMEINAEKVTVVQQRKSASP